MDECLLFLEDHPPGWTFQWFFLAHGDAKVGCGTPSKWPNFMACKWGLRILTTCDTWEPILQVTCLELPLQKLGSFFHPLIKPLTKKSVVSPILQVDHLLN